MNDDEGVGEHTLYLCSIWISDHGMCRQSFTDLNTCDFDVQFALLLVSESRGVCSNYKFLSEILNMY
jgi:hypothetical protein